MTRETTQTQYLIKDGHGSVISTYYLDVVQSDFAYDAYGNRATTSTGNMPLGYCGEYYDDESGLIYLRNRYYDPSIGRFINEDPVQDDVNWYGYCGWNPIRYSDFFGTITEEDSKYGESSKIYLALTILGEAWTAMPDYRTPIEELAKEIRSIGDFFGSRYIDNLTSLIVMFENSLSIVEQVLTAAYPLVAMRVDDARVLADKATKDTYNQKGDLFDEANAFKHMYWSALTTSYVGPVKAKLFLDAHEFGWYKENLNNIEAMKMDLHNNAEGRIIG